MDNKKIIVCGNGDNKIDIDLQMKIKEKLKESGVLDDVVFTEKQKNN